MSVTEDGLFQFGHSKDHRPDLPQLKINQSALDPLGIPLTTTIVSGEKADDPLYIPEIKKVQRSLQTHGMLYIGDCKMASLATRAYIAESGDFYLSPLSSVQTPAANMRDILRPVWNNEQELTKVYRPLLAENIQPEAIAEGFIYTTTLQSEIGINGELFSWDEQRLVVHSFKHAEKNKRILEAQTKKAMDAIAKLNQRGRGVKSLDEKELHRAVESILKNYGVSDFLQVSYHKETIETLRKAYRGREAYLLIETKITTHTTLETEAWENTIKSLGWRVYACNDKDLSLAEAVLAYRQEYLIEHGFARYKGKTLGLTPLYLCSTTRIKGLIRLLSIGLRILCLLEFTVQKALQERGEKLSGIYKGNPKRTTASPTAEMMLKSFRGISLIAMHIQGNNHREITPLTVTQERIIVLLGLPIGYYATLLDAPYQWPDILSKAP